MSHSHLHCHTHVHTDSVKNIKFAFFLNISFTIIELIWWFLTNSVAIMSDALHDLWDSIALWSAWYLQIVSWKKSDSKFTYGYARYSLLSALINCVILGIGSVYIAIEATKRILHPEATDPYGMIWLAVLGIIVNWLAVYKTFSWKTLNEKVVSLHLLEDVLGWVAILIGSIVILFTKLYIIDAILSIGIMLYILRWVIKNLFATLNVFLQKIPEWIEVEWIKKIILWIEWVKSAHDIHIWSLDGEKNILTSHIVLENSVENIKEVKEKIKNILFENNIPHATLEIEYESEHCHDYCK